MNDWSLARWEKWLAEHPSEVNVPRIVADTVLDDFKCHNTLLHLAVLRYWVAEMGVRSEDFVDLLLRNGANPNTQNDEGKTPLHLACELDTLSAKNVELLLANGADPMLKDNQGEIPFDRLFGRKEATQQIRQMLERAMKENR